MIDAAIGGNVAAVNKILDNLKDENVEPVLILWAITNELRSLVNMKFTLVQGTNVDQVLFKNNVRQNRKHLVKRILTTYSLAKLESLLKFAVNIDLIIKGAGSQRLLWHELKKIYLNFAGVRF